jgi:hypothetical protein
MYTGFRRFHGRLFPILQKHAGDELEDAGAGGGQHCAFAGGVIDQGEWTEKAARSGGVERGVDSADGGCACFAGSGARHEGWEEQVAERGQELG